MCSHPMMLTFAWLVLLLLLMLFAVRVFQFFWQLLEEKASSHDFKGTFWISFWVYSHRLFLYFSVARSLLAHYWVVIAAWLAFGKSSAHGRFGLAIVFAFLDPGLFLRALTKTDKMGNCHKIIPQWVNMSCICTGDFIFWLSDVFLEFASIPFQFISSHKSEPRIPFPASLTLHFRWFWPLSLFRLFS